MSERGNWNRAGRRSGGNRPFAIDLPRTDSTVYELAEAFTTMMHTLGEGGRTMVREHALKNADLEPYRVLLKAMNDYERVNEAAKERL